MSPKGVSLGGVYETSYCSFEIPQQTGEELSEMLDRVTNELTPHLELLSKIRACDGRIEFFIGWYSEGNTGDVFSYELMRKLGELGVDMAFDIYGAAG